MMLSWGQLAQCDLKFRSMNKILIHGVTISNTHPHTHAKAKECDILLKLSNTK